MFEKTPLLSLQVLTISNYLKGGDFMGSPDRSPEIVDLSRGRVSPAQAVVTDARNEPTHPLAKVALHRGGVPTAGVDQIWRALEEMDMAGGGR